MGCDIHGPFLEQSPGPAGRFAALGDYRRTAAVWSHEATFHVRRNYDLFALLAGVRADKDQDCPFPARGMPADISWVTAEAYQLYVSADGEDADSSTSCSPENADKWVRNGSSVVCDRTKEGRILRITNPDYHSASWLLTDEVEQVLARYQALLEARAVEERLAVEREVSLSPGRAEWMRDGGASEETVAKFLASTAERTQWRRRNPLNVSDLRYLRAMVAMMKTLETPECQCRIVFFFDN